MLSLAVCVDTPSSAAQAPLLAPRLRAARTSPGDLELSADAGPTRYLSLHDLLPVSQTITIAPDDGNFKTPSQVKAVPLENLARALGAPQTDMIVAICKDKYRGYYPRAYLAAHHPLLVIELNGKPLSDLPTESEGPDPGPYLIAHENFTPAFKILAFSDEPQIPWGVVRLEFRDEKTVFGAIAPRGPHAGDAEVQDGYQMARQNCFRCHNNGSEGGLKSGVTWMVLGALAANSPEFFAGYVRDPKAKNPKTQMAASPEYDDRTLRALIAYFRGFAPTEGH
jgi:mono/diheme cytochrome c family protein